MGGWKKEYGEDEIEIFEKGLLSKRRDYWHFRLWLDKEKKYVRRSLKTRNRHIAVELAKEMYLISIRKPKARKELLQHYV